MASAPTSGSLRMVPGLAGPAPKDVLRQVEARIAVVVSELESLKTDLVVLVEAAATPSGGSVLPQLLTVPRAAVAFELDESTVHSLIVRGGWARARSAGPGGCR